MKISYTLLLAAMVAITIERCRAEFLLVEVDDDDSRTPKNDEPVRVPNNDDEIRQREIEQLNRENICDIKPCCCDTCYPCPDHVIAELRKIAEERKAPQTKPKPMPNPKPEPEPKPSPKEEIVPTPRECCKKAGVPAFCLGLCSPAVMLEAMARQGNRINACSKYDTIIEGCFQQAEPEKIPALIKETSDDKDVPTISHGSPTIVRPQGKQEPPRGIEIPKQESQKQSRSQCGKCPTGTICCVSDNECRSSCPV